MNNHRCGLEARNGREVFASDNVINIITVMEFELVHIYCKQRDIKKLFRRHILL